jgi:hypothetical protein
VLKGRICMESGYTGSLDIEGSVGVSSIDGCILFS